MRTFSGTFEWIVIYRTVSSQSFNRLLCLCVCVSAMSKAAVKISGDLLSNPLCEQDQAFLESMNALDTAMRRMDAFNQEKVRLIPYSPPNSWCCITLIFWASSHSFAVFLALFSWYIPMVLDGYQRECLASDVRSRKLHEFLLKIHILCLSILCSLCTKNCPYVFPSAAFQKHLWHHPL